MITYNLRSGKADISLDKTISKVVGSEAVEGEGALKFGRDGIVTINTKFLVYSDQKTPYNTQFWFSKVNPDGKTFTKIIDSDVLTLIKPTDVGVIVTMPEFSIEVEAEDRIVLFGQSDVTDGSYIMSKSHDKPMIDIRINYKEIVVNADVPGMFLTDANGVNWIVTVGTDGKLTTIKQ